MITEVIRYQIPAEQAQAFETRYQAAEAILRNSKHCTGCQLLRGIEEPDNWILLLQWDSIEGHEQGFRQEPQFHQFLDLVKPFFIQIQEMKHYQAGKMQWSRSSWPLSLL